MDEDLVLIFTFITIVLMITGLSVNGIVSKVLKHRKEMREFEHVTNQRKNTDAHLGDRTDLIEARLQVLERIATDPTKNLADEIEQLRAQETLEGPKS